MRENEAKHRLLMLRNAVYTYAKKRFAYSLIVDG